MRFKMERTGNLENKKYSGMVTSTGDDDKLLLGETGYSFASGIVVDVFSKPEELFSKYYEEEDLESLNLKEHYKEFIRNKEKMELIPRNSIVAFILDDAISKTSREAFLCFPFFPANVSFSIKPGEHVWLLVEKNRSKAIHYWVCRKTGPFQVDDINHTFIDRYIKNSDIYHHGKKVSDFNIDQLLYNFHENYPNVIYPTNVTLQSVINGAVSTTEGSTFEPVPPVEKKCGDLLFQGSNNAYIHLTTEKFTSPNDCNLLYPKNYFLNDSSEIIETELDRIPLSPAIDISVAAFKNDLEEIADSIINNQDQYIHETENLTIAKNSRGGYEYNKANDQIKQKKKYMMDFNKPSATNCGGRIYMSNNCTIDQIFSCSFGDLSNNHGSALSLYTDFGRFINHKNFKLISGDIIKATQDKSDSNISYIEMKGGEPPPTQQESANGKKDRNGDIIIKPYNNKHIYLGSHDATEPGVLGDVLINLLDRLITALLNTVITTPAGPAGPMNASTLATDILSVQSELENIKSSLVKIK